MKVKEISFPIPLKDVEDIYDNNIDVFVDLQNGPSYTGIVEIDQNVIFFESKNSNFLPPW